MKVVNRRVYVSSVRLLGIKRIFRRRGVFYINGAGSCTTPNFKLKYISQDLCRSWPDLDGVVYPMLPGEAALMELRRAYPDMGRTGWRGKHISLLSVPMPMFCTRTYRGPGMYVDLVGAYCNIYRHLWIDVKFPCGTGRRPLRPVAERLEGWKTARNAVGGIIRSTSIRGVHKGRTIEMAAKNAFLNPLLWATIQYTLHGLGIIARSCGAIYCMTDGYIFDSQKGGQAFLDLLDGYQVPYRMIMGDVDVKGWQSYAIPGKQTKLYQKGGAGSSNFVKLQDDVKDPFKFPDWVFKYCRSLNERNDE